MLNVGLYYSANSYRSVICVIYIVYSIYHTNKARSTKSPPYLQSILQDYIPGRAVRSASRNLICESGTIYLTLYYLATQLHHFKKT